MSIESQSSYLQSPQKRRRTKAAVPYEVIDNYEQRMLQQALENSKRDFKREEVKVPFAPEYHPTITEFKDPMAYIER